MSRRIGSENDEARMTNDEGMTAIQSRIMPDFACEFFDPSGAAIQTGAPLAREPAAGERRLAGIELLFFSRSQNGQFPGLGASIRNAPPGGTSK